MFAIHVNHGSKNLRYGVMSSLCVDEIFPLNDSRYIFLDLPWRRSGYSPNQLKRSGLQIHPLSSS